MSTLWKSLLCGGWHLSLIIVLASELVLSAGAAEQTASAGTSQGKASIADLRARLTQQRAKITSLYLDTTIETTSPLKADELREPPPHASLFIMAYLGQRVEERFAFKGAKLYHRTRCVPPGCLPAQRLRADATEIEKAVNKKRIEGEKEYRRLEDSIPLENRGGKPTFEDTTTCFNERARWYRYDRRYKRPDGSEPPQAVSVFIYPPDHSPPYGGLIPPAGLLFQAGLAFPAKLIGTPVPDFERTLRENLLPDLFDAGAYTVSDNVETLDGARCLVLAGKLERTVQAHEVDVQEKYTTHDRLWLDLDHGLALRKREWTSTPGSRSVYRIVNFDFREIAKGVWLPHESEFQEIAAVNANDYPEAYRGKPVLVRKIKVTKCIANEVPDDLFEVVTKPGDMVGDQRQR